MKIVLTSIGGMLLVFSLFYLIGSFVECSLDIRDWSDTVRGFVGILGGLLAMYCGTYPFVFNDKK